MRIRAFISLGMAAALLAGCEQVWHSVYRETSLQGGNTLVTDAGQRVITNVPYKERQDGTGRHIPTRIVCAEPSPDVAKAISSALQASGNAAIPQSVAGAQATLSAAGQIAMSTAASLAQLGERLAVVQLLRDKMYRACEAYANGAVDDTGYVLMLARLDKTMTTLLASEMAAGAFGRALAQIGTSAGAGGVDQTKLAALRNAVTKASDDHKTALEAYKKAADALKGATAAPTQEQKDALVKADGALSAATKEFEKATKDLIDFEMASSVGASAASVIAATKLGEITGRGTSNVGDVAKIHQTYVDDDGLEPLADACLTRLSAATPMETIAGRATFLIERIRSRKAPAIRGQRDVMKLDEELKRSLYVLNDALRRQGLYQFVVDDRAIWTNQALAEKNYREEFHLRLKGVERSAQNVSAVVSGASTPESRVETPKSPSHVDSNYFRVTQATTPLAPKAAAVAHAATPTPPAASSDEQLLGTFRFVDRNGDYYVDALLDWLEYWVLDHVSRANVSGARDAMNYVCVKMFDEGAGNYIQRRLTKKLQLRMASAAPPVVNVAAGDKGKVEVTIRSDANAAVIDLSLIDMCNAVVRARATSDGQRSRELDVSAAMCNRLLPVRLGAPAAAGGGGAAIPPAAPQAPVATPIRL